MQAVITGEIRAVDKSDDGRMIFLSLLPDQGDDAVRMWLRGDNVSDETAREVTALNRGDVVRAVCEIQARQNTRRNFDTNETVLVEGAKLSIRLVGFSRVSIEEAAASLREMLTPDAGGNGKPAAKVAGASPIAG